MYTDKAKKLADTAVQEQAVDVMNNDVFGSSKIMVSTNVKNGRKVDSWSMLSLGLAFVFKTEGRN